jgi:L-threonylcarbamoyladenylate synthase
MTTTVVRVDPWHPDPARLASAAACLAGGGLVAFPTETVYGLGAHALDADALTRLFNAKERPAHDPVIVHVAALADVAPLIARIPPTVAALAARFWPGPLTLVLPKSSAVPAQATAGLETVAIRIPAHPVALALIAAAGVPVAAPSANLFSRPSPTNAAHVLEDLKDRIDMVVDGGATSIGVESTVLDLTGDVPTVLRLGAVSVEALRAIVPAVRAGVANAASAHGTSAEDTSPRPAPGMLATHYSPRTPLVLYEGDRELVLDQLMRDALGAVSRGKWVGVITANEDAIGPATANIRVIRLGSESDSAEAARRLFGAFRELDAVGVDLILVRGFRVTDGLGLAVRDRLRRAAVQVVLCGPVASAG